MESSRHVTLGGALCDVRDCLAASPGVLIYDSPIDGMDPSDYTYTFGMSHEEATERLRETLTGVLSLANEGEAYAVPVAHYYEDGALYLRLGDHPGSEKLTFAESTTRASYLVYDHDPSRDESWSVLVRGTLDPISETEEPDAATLDERYTALRVFGEAVDELDVVILRLAIDELTGRRTSETSE